MTGDAAFGFTKRDIHAIKWISLVLVLEIFLLTALYVRTQ